MAAESRAGRGLSLFATTLQLPPPMSWLDDLDDAQLLADQIYSDIHSSTGSGTKSTRNNQLQKQCNQLSSLISALKHGVDRDNSM
jgi:hypothetical protein